MMIGLRHPFHYDECARCGCLALAEPPPDMAPYYPRSYYSFRPPPREPLTKRWLRRQWVQHLLGRRNMTGALLDAVLPARPPGIAAAAAVGLTGADPRWSVLDIGSGVHGVLHLLHDAGFRSLLGVDPFIPESADFGDGLQIRKAHVQEVDGRFDLVMMHHSLEHVPDHAGMLREAQQRLLPGGTLLVRTPLAARSWREFQTDWFELDAPRHLLVHSTTSLRLLAERCGFELVSVVHDAGPEELWGSLQYRADIALLEPRSYQVDPAASPFSRADIRRMVRQVRELNRAGESGRAAFVLRRI
jgi:SAM-dependent methyltransferase